VGVGDHISPVRKLRGRVSTVDPSQDLVEVICQDRQARRLALFDLPENFRWPIEGEEWSIYEENGYWRLGNRFYSAEEREALRGLEPGQGLADGESEPSEPVMETFDFDPSFHAWANTARHYLDGRHRYLQGQIEAVDEDVFGAGVGTPVAIAASPDDSIGGGTFAVAITRTGEITGTGVLQVNVGGYIYYYGPADTIRIQIDGCNYRAF
jgi:hypothetical protein